MRLFRKRKTDAEYIEAVRRSVKRSRWFAIIFACGAILYYLLFVLYWRFIPSFGELVPGLDKITRDAFGIGMMLGAMGGLMVFAAASCIFMAVRSLTGERTARLMLKFHDQSKKNDILNSSQIEQTENRER